ncbi:MAG: hypothetical protein R3F65_00580 [bacterium]|nr:hypothetical protein [Myxococcales bacterium]MCB9552263.1 hypothetical protein [Myxococcales bacterium]
MFDADDAIEAGAVLRDPTTVPVGELVFADPPELHFEGFTEDTFAVLDRLRDKPDLEQFRIERGAVDGIDRVAAHVMGPFARYRDDLVVNFVAPSALRWETDRNVFSRLPKNDFGGGGCKSHVWLCLYRPPRRRLTDAQLSHSVSPRGFEVSLFVGELARDLLQHARARVADDPDGFLGRVGEAFAGDGSGGQVRLEYAVRQRGATVEHVLDQPPTTLPDGLLRAQWLAIGVTFGRQQVIAWGPRLVTEALAVVRRLWPLYRFLFGGRPA